MQIDYSIKIGANQFETQNGGRLLELKSDVSLNIPVNSCQLKLAFPEDLKIKVGEVVSVELGYDGSLKTVFTGIVESVFWKNEIVTIVAKSSLTAIVQRKINVSLEKPFAMDIIKAGIENTAIKKGKIEPGLQFANYNLGSNQNVYWHLKYVADLCGFDIYTNEKDELIFGRFLPSVPELFQYGINILECNISEYSIDKEGIIVYGGSPASFGLGNEAATWLTKKSVKGEAGNAKNARQIFAPTLRTTNETLQVADNIWAKEKVKKKGVLTCLGNAKLGIGAMITINGMKVKNQNGNYKIIGVNHKIHTNYGFISTLKIEEI